jgi:hypothetical protein
MVTQHAVYAAAKCAGLRVRARLAARPTLKEIARNAVADLDAGDARADLDHLAGAVG